jgi:hypothetical protein
MRDSSKKTHFTSPAIHTFSRFFASLITSDFVQGIGDQIDYDTRSPRRRVVKTKSRRAIPSGRQWFERLEPVPRGIKLLLTCCLHRHPGFSIRRIVLGGSKNVSKQKADSLQATAQSFSEEEIVEIPWHRGIPITRPQRRAELNILSSNFVSGLKWIPS